MKQINIRIPESLFEKFKAAIPSGQRNDFVTGLIAREIKKYDDHLFDIASAVEKDQGLQQSMKDWDVAISDGLDDEG